MQLRLKSVLLPQKAKVAQASNLIMSPLPSKREQRNEIKAHISYLISLDGYG